MIHESLFTLNQRYPKGTGTGSRHRHRHRHQPQAQAQAQTQAQAQAQAQAQTQAPGTGTGTGTIDLVLISGFKTFLNIGFGVIPHWFLALKLAKKLDLVWFLIGFWF